MTWFLRGQTLDKSCRVAVEFVNSKTTKNEQTFNVNDHNGKIWVDVIVVLFFINLVPKSHSVLHFPLAVGDLGTRLVFDTITTKDIPTCKQQ